MTNYEVQLNVVHKSPDNITPTATLIKIVPSADSSTFTSHCYSFGDDNNNGLIELHELFVVQKSKFIRLPTAQIHAGQTAKIDEMTIDNGITITTMGPETNRPRGSNNLEFKSAAPSNGLTIEQF